MSTTIPDNLKPKREQVIYANILLMGVWLGMLLLILTYLTYLSGLLPAHFPISEIPRYWGLGVNEYQEITNGPHGWGWLSLLGKGDFLNFLGFAFLGLITVFCFMVLLCLYVKSRKRLMALICALEILVLTLAASGMLGSGGH
jgi:hypothetical protein